ncbi:MAG: hydantoinase B/oxoprolinase family protein, partial [Phycisphaeraceae bacterium]
MFDDNVRRILTRNVRIPEVVWTDLSAQLAALADAEQRTLSLLQRFGLSTLTSAISRDVERTERYVRGLIGDLPDGCWQFTDHIDGDLPGLDGDLDIVCTLTIDGQRAVFDFTGSSPQVPVAINATESFTRAATLTAFLAVFDAPELRFNDGLYRALDVVVPPASLLAGRRPAPRAARGITGFRTIDTVLGVLAEVVPGRVMAAGDGGATMISLGTVEADGTSRVLVDFLCGAWGGRPNADGLDGASALGANLANVPIEELEANFPVRFVRYGLVPNSGGAGRFRGGLASIREFTFLADDGVLSIRSDRRRHRPYGLAGGEPGAPSENWLNPETD